MTSRRDFLLESTLAAAGLRFPIRTGTGGPPPAAALLDVRRPPDRVAVWTGSGGATQLRAEGGEWHGGVVTVTTRPVEDRLEVALTAPGGPVERLHLRWNGALGPELRVLGDAWERGYGDLEWRGLVPERAMPWYFAASDGRRTDGYGVRTGASAFCFWRADAQGVSLWADVRSGGVGVRLGGRTLPVCEVVYRPGRPEESAFAAVHALCRAMCPAPRLAALPVYGSNDWYYAYGRNNAETFLADARNVVDLSPAADANAPYVVMDDGWQPGRGSRKERAGHWDRGNEKFPDLPGLLQRVRSIGARPGAWIRPLLAPDDAPDGWRLPRDRGVLDPTVPAVERKVAEDVGRLAAWGFELVKHDFSTVDVLGRWGFEMGTALTKEGWTFSEGPARTTAEVLLSLYRTIRAAAGGALVLGCNTVGHLSAGLFELSRIGDDTSGREWARTRKMGVNSLGFRGAQHGAFFAADADCVGVTPEVPWEYDREWLALVAASGTPLFVSLDPRALGEAQRRDLRAAFARAARPQPLGEPLDWQHTVWPERWRLDGEERSFRWIGAEGVEAP